MVKIDGSRVRALREQKGLTQLYIATAVDVTTDTVSRWENKRYPTIKKENALKLADALEVDLGALLDRDDATEPAPARTTAQPAPEPVAEPAPAEPAATPAAALDRARAEARPGDRILVTGSFLMVAAAMQAIGEAAGPMGL